MLQPTVKLDEPRAFRPGVDGSDQRSAAAWDYQIPNLYYQTGRSDGSHRRHHKCKHLGKLFLGSDAIGLEGGLLTVGS